MRQTNHIVRPWTGSQFRRPVRCWRPGAYQRPGCSVLWHTDATNGPSDSVEKWSVDRWDVLAAPWRQLCRKVHVLLLTVRGRLDVDTHLNLLYSANDITVKPCGGVTCSKKLYICTNVDSGDIWRWGYCLWLCDHLLCKTNQWCVPNLLFNKPLYLHTRLS